MFLYQSNWALQSYESSVMSLITGEDGGIWIRTTAKCSCLISLFFPITYCQIWKKLVSLMVYYYLHFYIYMLMMLLTIAEPGTEQRKRFKGWDHRPATSQMFLLSRLSMSKRERGASFPFLLLGKGAAWLWLEPFLKQELNVAGDGVTKANQAAAPSSLIPRAISPFSPSLVMPLVMKTCHKPDNFMLLNKTVCHEKGFNVCLSLTACMFICHNLKSPERGAVNFFQMLFCLVEQEQVSAFDKV